MSKRAVTLNEVLKTNRPVGQRVVNARHLILMVTVAAAVDALRHPFRQGLDRRTQGALNGPRKPKALSLVLLVDLNQARGSR